MGSSKAEVAAKFVMQRVKGVTINPYCGKIQDKDEDYYMQFNLVICGLDSIEARRWINATLVGMVDMENPDSLKPLIDGGTEGAYLNMLWSTFLTVVHRLQGASKSHPTNHDELHRMPAGHARTEGGCTVMHPRYHSTSATALHRMGAYHCLGRRTKG